MEKKKERKSSKSTKKTAAKKVTKKLSKSKDTKKPRNEPSLDGGIVIVDDDLEIDQEKINEERRAYLEEARSQETTD